MGGCLSSYGHVFNQVSGLLWGKLSYIHNLEENIAALETTMNDLKARRNDLLRKVEREENKGLRRLEQIQVWFTVVQDIESQVDGLLSTRTVEIERLCLDGFCSTNLILSYRYGKQVLLMLEKVENLKSNRVFEEVAKQAQASEVVERPIEPIIVGRETMLETAWSRLMEDEVGIMGLYGMGGVGKTTLLTQINNRFLQKEVVFDIVFWVVVSKDLQIQKIQEEIAKKLGLAGSDCNHKSEDQKACVIHKVLTTKKFVLLLDDIWAKVDLKKIGIPYPNRENGSKVVFTTRSQEVCGRMRANVKMEVKCLTPNDAFDLFRKIVGEITLRSHPDIPGLARVVANKCQGLPLALNVIGEAMSCKRTSQEWRNAIGVLKSNAAKFSEMEDEILPILKFSYDNLKDEHVEACFLYCTLFPEDRIIRKPELIEYWICEGFIDESEGMERAENMGYAIIGSLVRSSLLIEIEHNIYDKVLQMHDVVREMGLWIASDCGKREDQFVVRAGAGLSKIPKVKNWNAVKRMSLMYNKINRITGSLECLELTTLFLQENKLVNISGEFFRSMRMLIVLDLSLNSSLCELPEEISKLVSLKYLNLSWTGIRCLPVGLQELKKLIHLDLESTRKLSSIVGISKLLNLRVVKLRNSGVAENPNTVEELQVLEDLEILSIELRSDSGLDRFLSSRKMMCCTQELSIVDLKLDISLLASMEKVRELHFYNCTISEININIASIRSEKVSPLQNPTNAIFLSLSYIFLMYCKCKDLTWLMFAPNLEKIQVRKGGELEDIINKEKGCVSEESWFVPFQKLEYMLVVDLPELKSIYWKPLPFPCLRELFEINCPKLRKLPLDSKSGVGDEKGLVIKYWEKEWIEGVEWEDEATKARFLPSSTFIHI